MKEKIKIIFRAIKLFVLVFILVFGIGLILFYFPYTLIKFDYLNIRNYTKIYELFNLIITSLTTLIGIYISVSLVAYEFFRQKSGVDFHKLFLGNRIQNLFISFSISVILLVFICSIFVSFQKPDYNEITIIYYSIFLFLINIISLFPIAFNLFSSFSPEKLADKEISKINSKTIFIPQSKNNDIDEQASLIENDNLLKTQNIVIALISVSDRIKAHAIILKVTKKLSEIIVNVENKGDKEYINSRLTEFYINIIDFTLTQPNNSFLLKNIWRAIYDFYYSLIPKKETSVNFEKFRKEFFTRYFNRLFENNKEEIIIEGIKTLRDIILEQVISNMPEDNKILFLNNYRRTFEQDFKEKEKITDEDIKNENHWVEIVTKMMDIFSFIINKSINFNKPELINKCFEEIYELTFQFKLSNVGIYKETYFFIKASIIITDSAYTAFEKKIFLEGSDAQYLTPILLENLIIDKKPYARTVLQKYCYLLIKLQKINKLNYWFLGGIYFGEYIIHRGELGDISYRCAINFEKGKEIQECLTDCIDTYEFLKIYFERKPPENFGLYIQIKERLKNILETLERENVTDSGIINKLKELISSFKEKEN